MEEFLKSLAPLSPEAPAGRGAADLHGHLAALSAGKRALLLQRLRGKQRQEPH
jgi:hypothetical protein